MLYKNMEAFLKLFMLKCGGQANRPDRLKANQQKGLTFRRLLSGVVCKPPYAASIGNCCCGEREGKTETGFPKVRIAELNKLNQLRSPVRQSKMSKAGSYVRAC